MMAEKRAGVLTRMAGSPMSGHFPPLDGLRGVAILMVLLHHCVALAPGSPVARVVRSIAEAGWSGVNLFFVLSGFLISGILLESVGSHNYYRNFYARRALRILPLYYAFLIAFQAFAWASGRGLIGGAWHPRPASWPVWLFLTNTPELFPVGAVAGPLGPLWSLAVEEQVYLFWPFLVAWLPPRRLLQVFGALIPASLIWRLVILAGAGRAEGAYSWMPSCLDAFAAGGAGAILVRDPSVNLGNLRRAAMVMVGGSLLYLSGLMQGLGHLNMRRALGPILSIAPTALSLVSASLIVFCVTSRPNMGLNRVLSARWLRGLGKYSFAIYLFHTAVFQIIEPRLSVLFAPLLGDHSLTSSALVFLATVFASLLAAMASYRYFEAPILSLKRHFPSSGRGFPQSDDPIRSAVPHPYGHESTADGTGDHIWVPLVVPTSVFRFPSNDDPAERSRSGRSRIPG